MRKMCISKAARLRGLLAAIFNVVTNQARHNWRTPWRSILSRVGIGFAALGALIGVLLPRTRQEDELLGEQSDQLVKATKEKGEELLERGKAVAQRVS